MVYSKKGELRFDDLCLEGDGNSVIKLQKCAPENQKQIWTYNNETKLMKHIKSGQCMMVDEKKDSGKFIVAPCEEGNQPKQRWYLERALFV
jgi:polypeptide N-acetylgalactosaminyltransferase